MAVTFGKKILCLLSLSVLLALWGGYFYLYSEVEDGRLGSFFDSGASCGHPLPSDQQFFKKDHLALFLSNTAQGTFSLSGVVNVSERTFNRYELGKYELRLRLERLQTSASDVLLIPEEVRLKPLIRNFAGPNRNASSELEPRAIRLAGTATAFPFDTYQYGYRPVLYILKGNEQIDLKFRHVTTTTDLSNSFTATQKHSPLAYFNGSHSGLAESDYPPYSNQECALTIERKGSIKWMVFLLLLVICLPLLHACYRDEPAIDFLATLLGVAAIRVFLVGPLNDFQLYGIDFAFGAVLILVGTVSLLKAMRISTLRDRAARTGSTW